MTTNDVGAMWVPVNSSSINKLNTNVALAKSINGTLGTKWILRVASRTSATGEPQPPYLHVA
jgi:hypothetical protein